jgi:hypothetical protein
MQDAHISLIMEGECMLCAAQNMVVVKSKPSTHATSCNRDCPEVTLANLATVEAQHP